MKEQKILSQESTKEVKTEKCKSGVDGEKNLEVEERLFIDDTGFVNMFKMLLRKVNCGKYSLLFFFKIRVV